MILGTMEVTIKIYGCNSLKDKRSIIKHIVNILRNRFNISISETGHLDTFESSVISIACVSNSSTFINKQLTEIEKSLEKFPEILVVNIDSQVF
jgi:uncharacterized protein YlxP (DUF503 family)